MARKAQQFKMNPEQQKLAADNLNLARREAWRQQRKTGIDYHTLEAVAFEGLCKAAYRYDPDKPHPTTGKSMKFSSLAVPTIHGELLHYIRDKTYALRLSHKMRERWQKGKGFIPKGFTDIEIAAKLGIDLEDWLEVRKVCSGPPLELKEQAKPTDALEAGELNFGGIYLELATEVMEGFEAHRNTLDQLEIYLAGTGNRLPTKAVDELLAAAGCRSTDWSEIDLDIVEGCEDLGQGRVQTSLF